MAGDQLRAAMADPRTPAHTTSDDVSCIDCGDSGAPMCDRCFGDWATATIKRLTFERDEARAAVDAARADERAKCEAEFGGDTLDIALTLARAGERRRNISHILTRAVINERRGYSSAAYALREVAGLIERGEFDDAAARS